jgi:hypothetical protein
MSIFLSKYQNLKRNLMIYIDLTESFSEWLRQEIKSKITKRYKLSMIAEDMGVSYMQLWRFIKGEKVSQDFIDKAMKFLS